MRLHPTWWVLSCCRRRTSGKAGLALPCTPTSSVVRLPQGQFLLPRLGGPSGAGLGACGGATRQLVRQVLRLHNWNLHRKKGASCRKCREAVGFFLRPTPQCLTERFSDLYHHRRLYERDNSNRKPWDGSSTACRHKLARHGRRAGLDTEREPGSPVLPHSLRSTRGACPGR